MVRLQPRLKAEPRAEALSFAPRPRRVAILADYAEEGWHSMDLAAELLMLAVSRHGEGEFEPVLLRPRMPRRLGRVAPGRMGNNADRWLARYLAYPRWLRRRAHTFDLFHVVDHSYAHLVHHLPPRRAVVTCHDLEAFRSLGSNPVERRPWWFRRTMRHVREGLGKAAHVFCDSSGVLTELAASGILPLARITLAPLPVHPDFSPDVDPAADMEVTEFLGTKAADELYLLHVGAPVPRKRLDVLLEVFAAVRREHPRARLVRAGGPLPAELAARAAELEVSDAIVELPFLGRRALAAVYRRAAVVLAPSEREGFGLPLVEAMACGVPVVASGIPPHREVGGEVVTYRELSDVDEWAEAVGSILWDRRHPAEWRRRREAALERAEAFGLEAYAAATLDVYRRVLGMRRG